MSRTINPDYSQAFLFSPNLEEWIGPEHPARFIRAFVDNLDLEALGISWGSTSLRGQPSYSAALLLKIQLYARFLGIRSFRKMELACKDNLAWIVHTLQAFSAQHEEKACLGHLKKKTHCHCE